MKLTVNFFLSPRFELPPLPDDIKGDKRKMPLVCHFCGEVGHKAGKNPNLELHNTSFSSQINLILFFVAQCPKIPSESKDIYRTPADASTHANNASQAQRDRTNLRPLDEVTCYRVKEFICSHSRFLKLPLFTYLFVVNSVDCAATMQIGKMNLY